MRYRDLADRGAGEPAAALRERVERARHRQLAHFGGRPIVGNALMTARELRLRCTRAPSAERLLEQAMTKLALSARADTRILKVARTIADLAEADSIGAAHVAEVVQYRSLDRGFH